MTGLVLNCPNFVKGYMVSHISRYSFTDVRNFSWMHCIKVRLYHRPNFMISVSLFPDNFSTIVPPDRRDFVSTICSMMPFLYSKGADGCLDCFNDL